MKTSYKAFVVLAIVFLLGYLDWLTTVYGLIFCGGTELNPVLSGLTKSSMLVFSAVKLTAVSLAALAAYKAADISKNAKTNWRFTNKFVNGGISLLVIALSIVVANNMMVVFRL
jgi:type III secretory pathway component EscU